MRPPAFLPGCAWIPLRSLAGASQDAARKGLPLAPAVQRRRGATTSGPVVGLITRPRYRCAAQPAPAPSRMVGGHPLPAREQAAIIGEARNVWIKNRLRTDQAIERKGKEDLEGVRSIHTPGRSCHQPVSSNRA